MAGRPLARVPEISRDDGPAVAVEISSLHREGSDGEPAPPPPLGRPEAAPKRGTSTRKAASAGAPR